MSPGPPSMPAVMTDTQSITSGLVTSQQLWSTCAFPITTKRPPETERYIEMATVPTLQGLMGRSTPELSKKAP